MLDDVDAALNWFDVSIVLLEQEQDIFALARTQSNRAALNLDHHEYLDEARELLYQAEAVQRTLQDRAGLVFTLHNIRVLRGLILSDIDA